jgi:hypothetical protein
MDVAPCVSCTEFARQVLENPVLQNAAIDFEARPKLTLDEVCAFPLPANAAANTESAVVLVKSQRSKSLCVLQSETCTVPFEHGYVVGSQDATTCVIAFVVTLYGVSCLHVDEYSCQPHYLRRRFFCAHLHYLLQTNIHRCMTISSCSMQLAGSRGQRRLVSRRWIR